MNGPCFFCGIGGSGMSALAFMMAAQGISVRGSDRSRDRGETPEKFAALERAGVALFPQDGSGVAPGLAALVVSGAIEESVPDVRAARAAGIPVTTRARILADMLNEKRGIAVGGTSGKTTVAGMIGHMLAAMDLDPSVVNGGLVAGFGTPGAGGWDANIRAGGGDLFVAETDESDGSIALFEPAIAVLNNITLDHKPLADLRALFAGFLSRAKEAAVVNLDDPESAAFAKINAATLTFAIDNPAARLRASEIGESPAAVSFLVHDGADGEQARLTMNVPGRHNVLNALAALGAARALGLDLAPAARALESFRGIRRRMEVAGAANGVTVIDDFAHNPDKIAATLNALNRFGGRIIAVFQPHGYGPVRLLGPDLAQTFATCLRRDDMLIVSKIYDAGGTTDRTVSAQTITDAVAAAGRMALYIPEREAIRARLCAEAKPGDRIVIMGARDDTLTVFAHTILSDLRRDAA